MIRLETRTPDPETAPPQEREPSAPSVEARRGFDYERFETRLQSLWFQRKAFLADGADEQAAEQAELIRALCREEGVRRLTQSASALIVETHRHLENGQYTRALDSLALAETLDPGRPQIRFARAAVLWKADGRNGEALTEWVSGVAGSLTQSLRDLSLFRSVGMVLVAALAGCVGLFSLLMVVRYQLPFRHEVQEFFERRTDERLAVPAGWAVLLLPLLAWVSVGWAAFYWLAVTFRFMRRSERAVTVGLLLGCLAALPVYRGSVAVYGMTADPVVRTTLASADGEYDPNRIVHLRQLVDARPEDASLRFLLAGLYRNGRFFEEAFEEYKRAIDLDPALEQAYVNIGNIFTLTGQYGEAIAYYQKAIDLDPSSVLARFDMHLAQAEAFRFTEAQETLREARAIDSKAVAELLASANSGERSAVVDAQLDVGTVWTAALGGREGSDEGKTLVAGLANPIGLGAVLTLVLAMAIGFRGRHDDPARRCIRCGQAFCDRCKTTRQGHEYCTQCVHLYVLGDGLAPETKTRKLYEVERHERRSRRVRWLVSLLFPGTAQLQRGRAGWGVLLLFGWLVAWIGARPEWLGPLDRFAAVDARFELLEPMTVPAVWDPGAMAVLSVLLGAFVWIAGNGWALRRGEG